jgi:hypothetical protein
MESNQNTNQNDEVDKYSNLKKINQIQEIINSNKEENHVDRKNENKSSNDNLNKDEKSEQNNQQNNEYIQQNEEQKNQPNQDQNIQQNEQQKNEQPKKGWGVPEYLLLGGGVAVVAASIPIAMGFGTGGVAAGSAAAGIQSGIGSVAADSLFATATSLGMIGYFAGTAAWGGVITGVGAAWKWAGDVASGVKATFNCAKSYFTKKPENKPDEKENNYKPEDKKDDKCEKQIETCVIKSDKKDENLKEVLIIPEEKKEVEQIVPAQILEERNVDNQNENNHNQNNQQVVNPPENDIKNDNNNVR